MTAEQLRKSILQQAISGKLVPQLDSEPAVEQLGDAPAEVPFEIPGKWKWYKLKVIGETKTGKTPSTNNNLLYGNYLPFVKPADISEKMTISYRKNEISEEGVRYSTIAEKDDLLMVCIGASIGKCALNIKKACFNQQINCLSPKTNISSKYLLYTLNSNFFQTSVLNSAGQTTLPIINKKKWENLFLPIPPLPEQKRIVAKIEQLLPEIDKLAEAERSFEELKQTLPKKLKASILQQAISGKLVPQLDSEPAVEQLGDAPAEVPFEIPGKWKWYKLKVIGETKTGKTPSTNNNLLYGNYLPFVKPADISEKMTISYRKNEISEEGVRYSTIAEKDDLLMVCIGASIGKCALNIKKACFNQQINCLSPKTNISSKYLLYTLNSNFFQTSVLNSAGQTTLPIINKKKWENLFLPIPPLPEQKRIVAKIEQLFTLIDKEFPVQG